jgi:hypothetical protein
MADDSKEPIDVTGEIHAETEKAVLFSDDGDEEHAVWLPWSQIEVVKQSNNVVVITMPVWLAKVKELI